MRRIGWLAGLGLLVATGAQAGPVGETHRMASEPTAALRDSQHRDQLRVTIWYPAAADAVERPLTIGPPDRPLFDVGRMAPDAAFAAGPSPVILLSHGFGGTARNLGWFGIALARAGHVVIAVDHPGNNAGDPMTSAGAFLSWDRAEDLRSALAAVRQDPAIAPHLDLARLGTAGFSAGGFTALVAAGARVDMAQLHAFCLANPEDGVCLPQREQPASAVADRAAAMARPAVQAELAHAGADHAAPGVRASFVLAPALVQALVPDSLRHLAIPVEIMLGDADVVAPPHTNGEVAAALIPGAQLVILPGVGHYDFLAACTEAGLTTLPRCKYPVPQAQTHAQAIAAAVAFFQQHLAR